MNPMNHSRAQIASPSLTFTLTRFPLPLFSANVHTFTLENV